MNAKQDQLAGTRLKGTLPAKTNSKKIHKVLPVGPPARRKTWFNSYDEEWAAFLAESSLKKSRSGLGYTDPEALPRVWNSPPA